jgi:hypothetical protein
MNKVEIKYKESISGYCEILRKTVADIEFLMAEIENETLNNVMNKPHQDILFDVVPILRKLKAAKKDAEESLSRYTRKSKKTPTL